MFRNRDANAQKSLDFRTSQPQKSQCNAESSKKTISKYRYLKYHIDYDYSEVNSSKMAQNFERCIKQTRKYRKETPSFLEDVLRKIDYLHRYNLKVAEVTFRYPLTENLNQLLLLYISLECKVLYKEEYYTRSYEVLIENRMLRLLMNIYYAYFESKAITQPKKIVEESAKAILKFLVKNGVALVEIGGAKNKLIENIVTKLLKKIGQLETVVALKGKPIACSLDTYLRDPTVVKVYEKIITSDYGSDDNYSDCVTVEEIVIGDDNFNGYKNASEPIAINEDDLDVQIGSLKRVPTISLIDDDCDAGKIYWGKESKSSEKSLRWQKQEDERRKQSEERNRIQKEKQKLAFLSHKPIEDDDVEIKTDPEHPLNEIVISDDDDDDDEEEKVMSAASLRGKQNNTDSKNFLNEETVLNISDEDEIDYNVPPEKEEELLKDEDDRGEKTKSDGHTNINVNTNIITSFPDSSNDIKSAEQSENQCVQDSENVEADLNKSENNEVIVKESETPSTFLHKPVEIEIDDMDTFQSAYVLEYSLLTKNKVLREKSVHVTTIEEIYEVDSHQKRMVKNMSKPLINLANTNFVNATEETLDKNTDQNVLTEMEAEKTYADTSVQEDLCTEEISSYNTTISQVSNKVEQKCDKRINTEIDDREVQPNVETGETPKGEESFDNGIKKSELPEDTRATTNASKEDINEEYNIEVESLISVHPSDESSNIEKERETCSLDVEDIKSSTEDPMSECACIKTGQIVDINSELTIETQKADTKSSEFLDVIRVADVKHFQKNELLIGSVSYEQNKLEEYSINTEIVNKLATPFSEEDEIFQKSCDAIGRSVEKHSVAAVKDACGHLESHLKSLDATEISVETEIDVFDTCVQEVEIQCESYEEVEYGEISNQKHKVDFLENLDQGEDDAFRKSNLGERSENIINEADIINIPQEVSHVIDCHEAKQTELHDSNKTIKENGKGYKDEKVLIKEVCSEIHAKNVSETELELKNQVESNKMLVNTNTENMKQTEIQICHENTDTSAEENFSNSSGEIRAIRDVSKTFIVEKSTKQQLVSNSEQTEKHRAENVNKTKMEEEEMDAKINVDISLKKQKSTSSVQSKAEQKEEQHPENVGNDDVGSYILNQSNVIETKMGVEEKNTELNIEISHQGHKYHDSTISNLEQKEQHTKNYESGSPAKGISQVENIEQYKEKRTESDMEEPRQLQTINDPITTKQKDQDTENIDECGVQIEDKIHVKEFVKQQNSDETVISETEQTEQEQQNVDEAAGEIIEENHKLSKTCQKEQHTQTNETSSQNLGKSSDIVVTDKCLVVVNKTSTAEMLLETTLENSNIAEYNKNEKEVTPIDTKENGVSSSLQVTEVEEPEIFDDYIEGVEIHYDSTLEVNASGNEENEVLSNEGEGEEKIEDLGSNTEYLKVVTTENEVDERFTSLAESTTDGNQNATEVKASENTEKIFDQENITIPMNDKANEQTSKEESNILQEILPSEVNFEMASIVRTPVYINPVESEIHVTSSANEEKSPERKINHINDGKLVLEPSIQTEEVLTDFVVIENLQVPSKIETKSNYSKHFQSDSQVAHPEVLSDKIDALKKIGTEILPLEVTVNKKIATEKASENENTPLHFLAHLATLRAKDSKKTIRKGRRNRKTKQEKLLLAPKDIKPTRVARSRLPKATITNTQPTFKPHDFLTVNNSSISPPVINTYINKFPDVPSVSEDSNDSNEGNLFIDEGFDTKSSKEKLSTLKSDTDKDASLYDSSVAKNNIKEINSKNKKGTVRQSKCKARDNNPSETTLLMNEDKSSVDKDIISLQQSYVDTVNISNTILLSIPDNDNYQDNLGILKQIEDITPCKTVEEINTGRIEDSAEHKVIDIHEKLPTKTEPRSSSSLKEGLVKIIQNNTELDTSKSILVDPKTKNTVNEFRNSKNFWQTETTVLKQKPFRTMAERKAYSKSKLYVSIERLHTPDGSEGVQKYKERRSRSLDAAFCSKSAVDTKGCVSDTETEKMLSNEILPTSTLKPSLIVQKDPLKLDLPEIKEKMYQFTSPQAPGKKIGHTTKVSEENVPLAELKNKLNDKQNDSDLDELPLSKRPDIYPKQRKGKRRYKKRIAAKRRLQEKYNQGTLKISDNTSKVENTKKTRGRPKKIVEKVIENEKVDLFGIEKRRKSTSYVSKDLHKTDDTGRSSLSSNVKLSKTSSALEVTDKNINVLGGNREFKTVSDIDNVKEGEITNNSNNVTSNVENSSSQEKLIDVASMKEQLSSKLKEHTDKERKTDIKVSIPLTTHKLLNVQDIVETPKSTKISTNNDDQSSQTPVEILSKRKNTVSPTTEKLRRKLEFDFKLKLENTASTSKKDEVLGLQGSKINDDNNSALLEKELKGKRKLSIKKSCDVSEETKLTLSADSTDVPIKVTHKEIMTLTDYHKNSIIKASTKTTEQIPDHSKDELASKNKNEEKFIPEASENVITNSNMSLRSGKNVQQLNSGNVEPVKTDDYIAVKDNLGALNCELLPKTDKNECKEGVDTLCLKTQMDTEILSKMLAENKGPSNLREKSLPVKKQLRLKAPFDFSCMESTFMKPDDMVGQKQIIDRQENEEKQSKQAISVPDSSGTEMVINTPNTGESEDLDDIPLLKRTQRQSVDSKELQKKERQGRKKRSMSTTSDVENCGKKQKRDSRANSDTISIDKKETDRSENNKIEKLESKNDIKLKNKMRKTENSMEEQNTSNTRSNRNSRSCQLIQTKDSKTDIVKDEVKAIDLGQNKIIATVVNKSTSVSELNSQSSEERQVKNLDAKGRRKASNEKSKSSSKNDSAENKADKTDISKRSYENSVAGSSKIIEPAAKINSTVSAKVQKRSVSIAEEQPSTSGTQGNKTESKRHSTRRDSNDRKRKGDNKQDSANTIREKEAALDITHSESKSIQKSKYPVLDNGSERKRHERSHRSQKSSRKEDNNNLRSKHSTRSQESVRNQEKSILKKSSTKYSDDNKVRLRSRSFSASKEEVYEFSEEPDDPISLRHDKTLNRGKNEKGPKIDKDQGTSKIIRSKKMDEKVGDEQPKQNEETAPKPSTSGTLATAEKVRAISRPKESRRKRSEKDTKSNMMSEELSEYGTTRKADKRKHTRDKMKSDETEVNQLTKDKQASKHETPETPIKDTNYKTREMEKETKESRSRKYEKDTRTKSESKHSRDYKKYKTTKNEHKSCEDNVNLDKLQNALEDKDGRDNKSSERYRRYSKSQNCLDEITDENMVSVNTNSKVKRKIEELQNTKENQDFVTLTLNKQSLDKQTKNNLPSTSGLTSQGKSTKNKKSNIKNFPLEETTRTKNGHTDKESTLDKDCKETKLATSENNLESPSHDLPENVLKVKKLDELSNKQSNLKIEAENILNKEHKSNLLIKDREVIDKINSGYFQKNVETEVNQPKTDQLFVINYVERESLEKPNEDEMKSPNEYKIQEQSVMDVHNSEADEKHLTELKSPQKSVEKPQENIKMFVKQKPESEQPNNNKNYRMERRSKKSVSLLNDSNNSEKVLHDKKDCNQNNQISEKEQDETIQTCEENKESSTDAVPENLQESTKTVLDQQARGTKLVNEEECIKNPNESKRKKKESNNENLEDSEKNSENVETPLGQPEQTKEKYDDTTDEDKKMLEKGNISVTQDKTKLETAEKAENEDRVNHLSAGFETGKIDKNFKNKKSESLSDHIKVVVESQRETDKQSGNDRVVEEKHAEKRTESNDKSKQVKQDLSLKIDVQNIDKPESQNECLQDPYPENVSVELEQRVEMMNTNVSLNVGSLKDQTGKSEQQTNFSKNKSKNKELKTNKIFVAEDIDNTKTIERCKNETSGYNLRNQKDTARADHGTKKNVDIADPKLPENFSKNTEIAADLNDEQTENALASKEDYVERINEKKNKDKKKQYKKRKSSLSKTLDYIESVERDKTGYKEHKQVSETDENLKILINQQTSMDKQKKVVTKDPPLISKNQELNMNQRKISKVKSILEESRGEIENSIIEEKPTVEISQTKVSETESSAVKSENVQSAVICNKKKIPKDDFFNTNIEENRHSEDVQPTSTNDQDFERNKDLTKIAQTMSEVVAIKNNDPYIFDPKDDLMEKIECLGTKDLKEVRADHEHDIIITNNQHTKETTSRRKRKPGKGHPKLSVKKPKLEGLKIDVSCNHSEINSQQSSILISPKKRERKTIESIISHLKVEKEIVTSSNEVSKSEGSSVTVPDLNIDKLKQKLQQKISDSTDSLLFKDKFKALPEKSTSDLESINVINKNIDNKKSLDNEVDPTTNNISKEPNNSSTTIESGVEAPKCPILENPLVSLPEASSHSSVHQLPGLLHETKNCTTDNKTTLNLPIPSKPFELDQNQTKNAITYDHQANSSSQESLIDSSSQSCINEHVITELPLVSAASEENVCCEANVSNAFDNQLIESQLHGDPLQTTQVSTNYSSSIVNTNIDTISTHITNVEDIPVSLEDVCMFSQMSCTSISSANHMLPVTSSETMKILSSLVTSQAETKVHCITSVEDDPNKSNLCKDVSGQKVVSHDNGSCLYPFNEENETTAEQQINADLALNLQEISPSKMSIGSNQTLDLISSSIGQDDNDMNDIIPTTEIRCQYDDHTYTLGLGGPLLSQQPEAKHILPTNFNKPTEETNEFSPSDNQFQDLVDQGDFNELTKLDLVNMFAVKGILATNLDNLDLESMNQLMDYSNTSTSEENSNSKESLCSASANSMDSAQTPWAQFLANENPNDKVRVVPNERCMTPTFPTGNVIGAFSETMDCPGVPMFSSEECISPVKTVELEVPKDFTEFSKITLPYQKQSVSEVPKQFPEFTKITLPIQNQSTPDVSKELTEFTKITLPYQKKPTPEVSKEITDVNKITSPYQKNCLNPKKAATSPAKVQKEVPTIPGRSYSRTAVTAPKKKNTSTSVEPRKVQVSEKSNVKTEQTTNMTEPTILLINPVLMQLTDILQPEGSTFDIPVSQPAGGVSLPHFESQPDNGKILSDKSYYRVPDGKSGTLETLTSKQSHELSPRSILDTSSSSRVITTGLEKGADKKAKGKSPTRSYPAELSQVIETTHNQKITSKSPSLPVLVPPVSSTSPKSFTQRSKARSPLAINPERPEGLQSDRLDQSPSNSKTLPENFNVSSYLFPNQPKKPEIHSNIADLVKSRKRTVAIKYSNPMAPITRRTPRTVDSPKSQNTPVGKSSENTIPTMKIPKNHILVSVPRKQKSVSPRRLSDTETKNLVGKRTTNDDQYDKAPSSSMCSQTMNRDNVMNNTNPLTIPLNLPEPKKSEKPTNYSKSEHCKKRRSLDEGDRDRKKQKKTEDETKDLQSINDAIFDKLKEQGTVNKLLSFRNSHTPEGDSSGKPRSRHDSSCDRRRDETKRHKDHRTDDRSEVRRPYSSSHHSRLSSSGDRKSDTRRTDRHSDSSHGSRREGDSRMEIRSDERRSSTSSRYSPYVPERHSNRGSSGKDVRRSDYPSGSSWQHSSSRGHSESRVSSAPEVDYKRHSSSAASSQSAGPYTRTNRNLPPEKFSELLNKAKEKIRVGERNNDDYSWIEALNERMSNSDFRITANPPVFSESSSS